MAETITATKGGLAFRVNGGKVGAKYPVTITPAIEDAALKVNGAPHGESYAVTASQWAALRAAHGNDKSKVIAALKGSTLTLADRPKVSRPGRKSADQTERLDIIW